MRVGIPAQGSGEAIHVAPARGCRITPPLDSPGRLITTKVAKLYEGRGQQIKTALVEGLGNTYGFAMARKGTLSHMIARMVGTLLLHGRDITAAASPRYM